MSCLYSRSLLMTLLPTGPNIKQPAARVFARSRIGRNGPLVRVVCDMDIRQGTSFRCAVLAGLSHISMRFLVKKGTVKAGQGTTGKRPGPYRGRLGSFRKDTFSPVGKDEYVRSNMAIPSK